MSPHLCLVCRSIPPKLWCHSFNLKENSRELCVKLQTLEGMEAAKENGCQLCTILLDSPQFCREQEIFGYKLCGKNEMLHLRRSLAFPERAVELGVGPKGAQSISRTFFYRMPAEWCHPGLWAKELEVKTGDIPDSKPVSINEIVDNAGLMKNWLRMCKEEHAECSKHRSSFLPTRLLDVWAFERSADVRLIASQSLVSDVCSAPTYLTLSHCWGKTQLITTTTKNIESRKDRISFSDLSQTFRDAVTSTRELGQRYLWIDSLCIIQDDKEDWVEEAAKMAKVYGNAYCTLAALSSADGQGGCHREAYVQKSMNNTFFDLPNPSCAAEPYIRIFCKEPTDWKTDYDGTLGRSNECQSPLRYRAWVLQERELSRRSIHFGKCQLLWECKQMKASAQLPWLEMKKKKGLTYPEGWLQLVEDYSLRALTKSEDKLPALSGVAEQYQEHKAQYMAGLWSSQLPAALMWQSTDPYAKRHDAYRAPSWSWASIEGRVSYDSQRLVPPYEDYSDPRDNPPRMLNSAYGGIELEQAVVKPNHPSYMYGEIKEGAYIELKSAYLFEIDVPAWTLLLKEQGPKRDSEPLLKNGRQVGVFYRDTMDNVIDAKTAFMLVLQNESIFPRTEHPFQLHQSKDMIDTVMGIVIVGDRHHKYSFMRLGLARWVDEALLEGTKPCNVRLV
ncbi:heterokaryon incompatibility protein-domain-containing protein [Boeremia exigua]|uniref:heterokaryon incompatibility protein-domain-containing protein n=1 Tax=Boeremia exigua TaxID=749465 RepID=UPI001E8EAD3C|nr:heterokaryon incompatibility protein-domain-containing protein [Boeremia exigua]KAH6625745.1 heterokaryon incompatibility protein-domain-containing protein [Boeremia exigua]